MTIHRNIYLFTLFTGFFVVSGVWLALYFFASQQTSIDVPSPDSSSSINHRNLPNSLEKEHNSLGMPATAAHLDPPPQQKQLAGVSQVFQTFNNCGPSSLSMALSFHGVIATQEELGQSLRPYQHPTGDNDDKSVTLAELALKAEEYGFKSYHRPAGNMDLVISFIQHDMPVITRTLLEPDQDIGHYRVITGFNQNTESLTQNDSLQGANLEYSYAEFNELWRAFNYEYLVLVPLDKQDIAEVILGEHQIETNAWLDARELALSQLEENPSDVYARFNVSVAEYHLGNFNSSISQYELVSDKLPSRMLWYQIEPLLAYYAVADYDSVLKSTDTILNSQNRAYSELHYLKSLLFEAQGLTGQAQDSRNAAEQYNSSIYWKQNLP